MATSPTSGPGGGGGNGLPSQWTVGSHGDVIAETDDGNFAPLTVQGAADQGIPLLLVQSDDDTAGLEIDGDGLGGIRSFAVGTSANALIEGSSTGALSLGAAPNRGIDLSVLGSGQIVFDAARVIVKDATAAPADATLDNSSFALWLDATPGVGNTKLMVKAKDSAGTVRTAAIVLA